MDKKLFIEAYFENWRETLKKAKMLLEQDEYYLEGILILSCVIGAFASLRFPKLKDNEAYKKIVFEYSGEKEFYEKIDLLFFYQWPNSEFKDNRNYKQLGNHKEIANVLVSVYGNENKIKTGTRYVRKQEIIRHILSNPFKDIDEKNIEDKLPLFSICEMLYRFVRCNAVHNVTFPFVNIFHSVDGKVRYKDNHIITGRVLYQTTENILNNLKSECIRKYKWPHEL